MTEQEKFEKEHNVLIIEKHDSYIMRFIGFFSRSFMWFWTTYRLPFQNKVRICYPDHIKSPMRYLPLLAHELIHARSFAKWYGPVIQVSTILPPFRWYVQRPAYLHDIKTGRETIESAVETLWFDYGVHFLGVPSQKTMTIWFEEQLK